MNERPWYKRYPADFLASTIDMTFDEKGAYSIILDLIYDKGGEIDDDPQWISRALGMSIRKWKSIRLCLIERGKLTADNGVLKNKVATKRLENDAKTARKLSENAPKNIREFNEKRAEVIKNNDLVKKTPHENHPNTRIQSPDRKIDIKPEQEKDDFQKFWDSYPNQTGIGAARTSFSNQIFFKGAKSEQIVAAAKSYASKQRATDTKFIPKPSKWLDDQTYLDPDLNRSIKMMDTSDMPEWVKKLADRIGLVQAKSWFGDAELTKDKLILANKFKADYVMTHFQLSLKDFLSGREITFKGAVNATN